MPHVDDVANYILRKIGQPVSAWKLQKLVYYAQAWSLIWDEEPLFPEPIEAWANGPVCRQLFNRHKGMFLVSAENIPGDPRALSRAQQETIDAVIEYYGYRPSQWLSDLTHNERPWREAREGLPPGERGDREISLASMADYYGSL